MIDYECLNKLQNAKNIWSTEMNKNSAQNASKELQGISPLSKCYKEVQLFIDEMKNRIMEIDKKEWDFISTQENNINNLRLFEIETARQIGVAYGNNQPQNINYKISGWW